VPGKDTKSEKGKICIISAFSLT